MGLFRKDWGKELDRVEDLLARNLLVPALEIAERAERKAAADLQGRAAGLALRARQALLTSVLAKVDAAEAAGDLEDAADWLLSALEREPSAMRRAELEVRRQALLDRLDHAGSPFATAAETPTVTAVDREDAGDASFQYETLVTMLSDEVAALYAARPREFQQAVVDLNEGRTAEALAAFESLGAEAPEDAALRLELGRARLLSGDAVAARDDFAAAWEVLGDEPLDAGGSQYVAALWAEAALAAGEAGAVVERLAPLAAPESGPPEICRLHATALLAAGRLTDAVGYLEEVTALLPKDAELNLLAAQALAASGAPGRAIAGLEQVVAASCGAGGCATPAAHLPSFRLLARLHLTAGGRPERARELIALVANAQRGALGAEDHAILAEYYRATGDHESAADAAAEAERLAARGGAAFGEVQGDLAPAQRRVL